MVCSRCFEATSWLPNHKSPPPHQHLPGCASATSPRDGSEAVLETCGIHCGQWVRVVDISSINSETNVRVCCSIIAFTRSYVHVRSFCGPHEGHGLQVWECPLAAPRRMIQHSFGRTRRCKIHGAVSSIQQLATTLCNQLRVSPQYAMHPRANMATVVCRPTTSVHHQCPKSFRISLFQLSSTRLFNSSHRVVIRLVRDLSPDV
ncbi:hypothetical protein DFH06DRAFT_336105 [Mycena polygramma]|nr:hypothetical protein DFH06DRAFT_336105 [Mycena polygramma]